MFNSGRGIPLEGLGDTLRRLAPRWFVTRDAHSAAGTVLLQPRWAMSLLKGPMTRSEIRAALAKRDVNGEAVHEGTAVEGPASTTPKSMSS
jgi:hypothetical protein